ncbi:MAG: 3-carboxy-cis,cis-muconate cycloisomerase [Acidobacteriia bacterium]|nr:3-carboxy-cis,cis-muconate cycloisomerase [Terriglobia bacterium]
MFTRLIDSLSATEALSRVFSDGVVLQAMLDFEAALAQAEARLGLIPADAAAAIGEAAVAEGFDAAELARQSWRAGTPAIPLARFLTERVRALNPLAAGFVHWGATSQDVTDTAMVLLLGQCRKVLEPGHERVSRALHRLSNEHARTVMLGRTLLQPAPPITFGLKAAGWLGAVRRGWARVAGRFDEAAYLQFGGASGTLAALGDGGLAVSQALAAELSLKCPDAPWHAHRDRLAALMAALGVYTASLGKMALDIALLMQYEVGEAAEPGGGGRGGSSTMPHKRNPAACMLALAASKRTPGLVADFLAGMVQEHERAVGGWQAEWATVQAILQSAGVALESMAEAAEGLTVDAARMRRNIDATQGAVFAEKAMMLLAPEMGREAAHRAVEECLRETGRPPDLPGLREPEDYLGSAEAFRLRLLEGKE